MQRCRRKTGRGETLKNCARISSSPCHSLTASFFLSFQFSLFLSFFLVFSQNNFSPFFVRLNSQWQVRWLSLVACQSSEAQTDQKKKREEKAFLPFKSHLCYRACLTAFLSCNSSFLLIIVLLGEVPFSHFCFAERKTEKYYLGSDCSCNLKEVSSSIVQ